MTTQAQSKQNEQQLDEQQVIDYLMQNPDFFLRNSLLLADMEIPHETGTAVSLIERQVFLLREKNRHFDQKLREMVDAVHDNQRLNSSLQRLAINLFMNDGLDDVIAMVNNELRNELGTDCSVIRLLTEDKALLEKQPERYLLKSDEQLDSFGKLIDEKRIQCGRMTDEQIAFLFQDDCQIIGSAAVIPLADAETYGVIGLGSKDEQRYHPGMGTDFLQQLADLVSAAMKPHL
ncbi:MAG: DUF484 family protein [Gammaproteobacteria bacterium]|nr:DUF484 family protein [Gammaproteobacteria bacterium]